MTQETKSLIGIGIATLVIVIGAVLFLGGKPAANKEVVKITTDQQKILIKQDSHKKVAKNQKITLVEFGDFQCPACGAVHPIVEKLLADYKNDVTFIFREYPLPMHQNSHTAAQAAEAAGEQGKFFEMYDALFEHQADWESSKKPMDIFEQYAKELKLDVEKFKEAIASKKYDKKIESDLNDGNALGVNSTPTFFLGDEKIAGGLPYDQFKEKIEAVLKAKK